MWYSSGKWENATYTPLEFYNSTDYKTLKRHCKEAKYALIDGFIISFWGIHEINKLKLASRVFDECGLKYTVYVESGKSASDVINQVNTVLKIFGGNKGFLRINGKPAIFLYGRVIDNLNTVQLDSISKALKGILIFADERGQTTNVLFKNLHKYIVLSRDIYFYKNFCKFTMGYCAVPVSPGFKMKGKSKPFVPRKNGKFYIDVLKLAINSDADILLITSFNEWWEGTNIEPSKEFGNLYLKITRKYARIFKKTRRKGKKRFNQNINIPKFQNKACFISNPKDFTPLMFEKIKIFKNPHPLRDCDVIIYATGEYYDTLWNPFIMDYIRNGGKMLVTGGPFPFYYDISKKYVNMAYRFGLKLGIVDDNILRGEFKAFLIGGGDSVEFLPFGERRIRELRDYDEKFYEILVCKQGCKRFIVSGRKGNVYYVWKGLVDSPYGVEIVRRVLKRMGF